MQAASRASLSAARERFDQRAEEADQDDLERLGGELTAVAGVLGAELIVRRHLGDASAPEESRRSLARELFGERIQASAAELLDELVASRWSRPLDLVDAIDELGSHGLFAAAEREGSLDDVEDELFRFGRILADQPRLGSLLIDENADADRRVELLDSVLADRARSVTRQLLAAAVRAPRHRKLEDIVELLVERAAQRRERSVAHVTVAAPLTEDQERRLGESLGRIYRRQISLKIELDPELLGGLVVRVGDEVIDGSVLSRFEKARQWLSH